MPPKQIENKTQKREKEIKTIEIIKNQDKQINTLIKLVNKLSKKKDKKCNIVVNCPNPLPGNACDFIDVTIKDLNITTNKFTFITPVNVKIGQETSEGCFF